MQPANTINFVSQQFDQHLFAASNQPSINCAKDIARRVQNLIGLAHCAAGVVIVTTSEIGVGHLILGVHVILAVLCC